MNRKGFEKDLRAYLSDEYDIQRIMGILDRHNVAVKRESSVMKPVSSITFTPEEIEDSVCEHFGISSEELYYESPEPYYARFKKIYAYLLYRYAKMKIMAIVFHVKRSRTIVGRNILSVKSDLLSNTGVAKDVNDIVTNLTSLVVIEN
jgi:chromosomal replication initiation ATPase DnaA